MKHGIYHVREWGDYVNRGEGISRFVTMNGVAKGQDHGSRIVANEFACGLLAGALGLPCPSGEVVHEKVDGDFSSWYVMLKFGALVGLPSPANLEHLANDHQDLYCGIVAFDAWVMNVDRHEANIAYIRGKQPPMIFDHGMTLGGTYRSDLTSLPRPTMPPDGHSVMRREVTSPKELDIWAERIRSVARTHLPILRRRLVDEGLLNKTETKLLCDWLDARSQVLSDLLRTMFPKLDWGLG